MVIFMRMRGVSDQENMLSREISLEKSPTTCYTPHAPIIIIVGNYGSGKTEVAVNLAVNLQKQGKQVQIADLDVVNPYFRCREARIPMEALGICQKSGMERGCG